MEVTVGMKVARVNTHGFGDTHYRADEVVKVFKNGNFVLKSDPKQQWRPGSTSAYPTGQSFVREHAVAWDEELEATIGAQTKRRQLRQALAEVKRRVNAISEHRFFDDEKLITDLTDAMDAHDVRQAKEGGQ